MTPSVSTPPADAERIELLPCPFCGNKAEMGRQAGGFIVRCLGCYGTGSERLREDGAVRSWNTRAAQRPAPLVDRETLAEAMWQAESVRTLGKRRLVPWSEAGRGEHERFFSYTDAILARLSAQPRVAVPEGWKLVPVEPTLEMQNAWVQLENSCAVHNYGGSPDAVDVWTTGIEAAPTHPTTDAESAP